MGRHINTQTGVVFSVDDSKDDRYASALHEPAKAERKSEPKKAPAKSTEK